MPTINDILPTDRLTDAERRSVAEAQGTRPNSGFFAGVDAAFNVQSPIPWAVRRGQRGSIPPNYEFRLTKESLNRLTDGIPEDYWESFESVESEEEARLLRMQLLDITQSRETLANMGIGGAALEIGAAIIDPVALAAGFATGGAINGARALGVIRAAGSATRVRRMIGAGLATASTEVPIEAFLVANDPLRDWRDIAWSGVGSFTLGGLAGLASGRKLTSEQAKQIIQATEPVKVKDAATALSRTPLRMTDDIGAPEFAREYQDEFIRSTIQDIVGRAPAIEVASAFGVSEDAGLSLIWQAFGKAGEELDDVSEAVLETVRSMIPVDASRAIATAFGIDPGDASRLMSRAQQVTDDIRRQLDANSVAEAGSELTADGAKALSARRPANLVDGLDADDAEKADIAASIADDLSANPVSGAMGAAAQRDLAGRVPSKASFGFARFGMVARMQDSKIPMARDIAPIMAEDVLPDRAGNAVRYSASEQSMRLTRVDMSRYHRTRNAAIRDLKKSSGKRRLSFAEEQAFDERVGRAVRGAVDNDPSVQRMVSEVRAMNREILQRAKDSGVRGFENVDTNDNYLARFWSRSKINNARAKYGNDRVVEALGRAFERGSDDIDEDKGRSIARALLKAIDSKDYTGHDIAGAFGGDNAELLRRTLTETGELTDAQIDDILGKVGRTPNESPLTSRGKRRLRLDETYVHTYSQPLGEETVQRSLSVADLLENNVSTITAVYTRQMNGAIAFQGVLDAMKRSPDDDLSSWDALRSRFQQQAAKVGASKADFETNGRRLDILQRSIRGLPIHDQSAFNEGLRILRNVQFSRVMNQVGFAQVAELGMIVGEMGVRTMMQQMPALSRLTRDAKTGLINNRLGSELEGMLGIGTNHMRNEVLARFDHETFIPESTKAIQTLERMNRTTSAISGMAFVDDGLRKFAGVTAAQSWFNFARSGKLPRDIRIAGMGLTREEAGKIIGQMKAHSTSVDGAFGPRLDAINLEKWDPDIAAKFTVSLDKWTRRVIQDNDIGSMSMWMTSELGRSLIQFRTFVLNAWERQTLYALRTRDMRAFSAFSATMFFGTLAYIGQTYANAIGRDDREEYLAQRLNPGAIARAAFQRSGFSSILPPAIDTTLDLTGNEPFFNNYARTTGLASGFISGSPTVDFFDNAYRAVKGIGSAISQSDNDFSERDADAILRLLPFQNALGIKQVLERIGSQFPEE